MHRWLIYVVIACLPLSVSALAEVNKATPVKANGENHGTLKKEIRVALPKLKKDSNLHPLAHEENWYLSGFVETEQGERFGYYFIVVRQGEHFHYYSEIINMQAKKVVYRFSEHETIPLETRQGINFKIGHGFLRYNDINDSWIFGVDDKEGFNLRVESLYAGEYNISHLHSISFYTLQSRRVNGQLTFDNKTEFVTSTNSWVAHQWQNGKDEQITLQRLLCRFTDNQGLMLVRAYQAGTVIFSLADMLDSHGDNHPVSQFSLIQQIKPLQWQVRLFSPKKNYLVQTQAAQQEKSNQKLIEYYLGLVDLDKKGNAQGVCAFIKESPLPHAP